MNNLVRDVRNFIAFMVCIAYVSLHSAFFRPILSPAFGIAVAAVLLSLITWIQKKDTLAVKISSYSLFIGALLALYILTTAKGTGNLEGWEVIWGDLVFVVAELVAIVSYSIGLVKK